MVDRGLPPAPQQPLAHLDVRPPLLARIVAFPLAATLFGMGLIGLQYTITERQLPGLVVVAIFLAFGAAIWRLATARLTFDDDVLVVRNYFRTHRMKLRDIDRFDAGTDPYGIELWPLNSDRRIPVNSIQKRGGAVWRGTRPKADELVDQLNALVLAARR